MSDANIITQSALSPVKTSEDLLAANLIAHTNDSLSKAHGWTLLYLANPTLDANGNDITYYRDSFGDVVGYKQLQLTYNNVNYYAPCNPSVLAGQDAFTGIVLRIVGRGAATSAWVTDFTGQSESIVDYANNQILLPHTQLSHWETHSGNRYTVYAQVTTDSAGHKIGNYVAKVIFNSQELLIPCDVLLGGPVKTLRLQNGSITTKLGTNFNACSMGANDNQYGFFWYNPPIAGMFPYTVQWQVMQSPSSGAWNNCSFSSTEVTTPTDKTVKHMMTGNRITFHAKEGSDSRKLQVTVRIVYTDNAGQTAYSNWGHFYANDEDGCGFISGPDSNASAWYENIVGSPP